MFNSLTGSVTHKDNERMHLLLSGVEWDLSISGSTSAKLPAIGEEVRVFTFLYHREDQMKLFGFASSSERELFLSLLQVNGVGPRLIMRMLSSADENLIRNAVQVGDVDSLARVPGLGAKSAQKIILSLRGKSLGTADGPASFEVDVMKALLGMGFSQREASDALGAVSRGNKKDGNDLDEASMLRAAIQHLGTTR